MNERRRATRYPLEVPLDAQGMAVTTRDISTDGIYFSCERELGLGTKLEFELQLTALRDVGVGRVRCTAEVIRVEPQDGGRVGVGAVLSEWTLLD